MGTSKLLAGLCAAAGLIAPAAANAGVTVETSSFISSPQAFNGFEGISNSLFSPQFLSPAAWDEGGIQVTGTQSQVYVSGFMFYGDGNHIWYGDAQNGYTDIKLDSGKAFNEIQFIAGSGSSWYTPSLQYELLLKGNIVAEGTAGTLPMFLQNFVTYGFTGAAFDEVRLQGTLFGQTFNPSNSDVLAIDSIEIAGIGGVPEPATWALMILGVAMVGMTMRRRRDAAPSAA